MDYRDTDTRDQLIDSLQSDLDTIAQELGIRMDFEHDATILMQLHCQVPPSSEAEVLNSWCDVLESQDGIMQSVSLVFNSITGNVIVGNRRDDEADWWRQLPHEVHERIATRVKDSSQYRSPVALDPESQACVIVCPCNGIPARSSLAVIANRSSALIQWMTDNAAVRAGLQLAAIHAQKERERAYRNMASRIGHMIGSDILCAQLRIRQLEHLQDMPQKAIDELSLLRNDLLTAQQGLDRARLLSIPWTEFEETVDLVELILGIGSKLNLMGTPCVDFSLINNLQWGRGEVSMKASRTRLEYALRDLIVGTWLLSSDHRPVVLELESHDHHIVIRIAGGSVKGVMSDARELEGRLRDPAAFLVSPDDNTVERVIGFQLAWHLIEEVSGSVKAFITKPDMGLMFAVNLPCRKGDPTTDA